MNSNLTEELMDRNSEISTPISNIDLNSRLNSKQTLDTDNSVGRRSDREQIIVIKLTIKELDLFNSKTTSLTTGNIFLTTYT